MSKPFAAVNGKEFTHFGCRAAFHALYDVTHDQTKYASASQTAADDANEQRQRAMLLDCAGAITAHRLGEVA